MCLDVSPELWNFTLAAAPPRRAEPSRCQARSTRCVARHVSHSKRISLTAVGFASGPFSSVFEVSHSVSRPSKRNVKVRKFPARISAGFFAAMRLVVSSLPLISYVPAFAMKVRRRLRFACQSSCLAVATLLFVRPT